MVKEILCGYGVDVDAVGGRRRSYPGEDSPCEIGRGRSGPGRPTG